MELGGNVCVRTIYLRREAMINKRFIKIDEASELTRLKPKTIREYCSRRLIPHIKLRGAVLFDTEDLEAWLEDSKVKPIRQLSKK
jgi:excisionase family DNA binding protein